MKYALVLCALLLGACSNDPSSLWYAPAWSDAAGIMGNTANNLAVDKQNSANAWENAAHQSDPACFNAQLDSNPYEIGVACN